MSNRYPPINPRLPALPGVLLKRELAKAPHIWRAYSEDGLLLAKSPWKKLTWKTARAKLGVGS